MFINTKGNNKKHNWNHFIEEYPVWQTNIFTDQKLKRKCVCKSWWFWCLHIVIVFQEKANQNQQTYALRFTI